jgi:Zn-dependent peptidase ImmA (M78 family)
VATTHVPVAPDVLQWALKRGGRSSDQAREKFARWDKWLTGNPATGPTPNQLQQLAAFTGVPFGFLLLRQPPELALPIADFREGHTGGRAEPSADLLAVLNQSILRQEWYRDYARRNDLAPVAVVGEGRNRAPVDVAADMRVKLHFEVHQRAGSWADTRRSLLEAFEGLGGLTVTTSMVGNNTHRPLDADEFRGFSLVDNLAPLVFVNARQTLNGQLFTLAHEFAHVWRGEGGIGSEDIHRSAENDLERWCNEVAAEFLVPQQTLRERFSSVTSLDSLPDRLDRLATIFRCGTLVVLQAIRRAGLVQFNDFDAAYAAEMQRLRRISDAPSASTGGDHYLNQPYRVGRRLSRAVVADAMEGRTSLTEAMALMSMKSLKTFDEYAGRLRVGA